MNQIDPNIVASQVTTELIRGFFSELSKKSINFLTGQYSYLFEDFQDYVESTLAKCGNLNVIINKNLNYEFDEIYVSSKFTSGDFELSDDDLIYKIRELDRIVVTGFGGIGKTIFSKKVWMTIFKESEGKIPIFFELRRLNEVSSKNLLTNIRVIMSKYSSSLDERVFNQFIRDGRFIFILDGFDELPENLRDDVEMQILTLANECNNCGLVVSGRSDERFYSWERFEVFKAQPFRKSQIKELIQKIKYDKTISSKFLSEIVEKRFEDYQSFLETPLLALMMLMTFSQSGEVPDKRSVFYKYAFMTLFSWHDGSKEAFKRESKTGLDVDQFEKLFSIFCLLTYVDHSYQIDRNQFVKVLDNCKKYIDFEFDKDSFIKESVESVNLLYKEGDDYIFTHRSFQEYFTAFACVNYFQSKLGELSVRLYRGADSVLSLMNDINGNVVDEYLICPEAAHCLPFLQNFTKLRSPEKIITEIETFLFVEVVFEKGKGYPFLNADLILHDDWSRWGRIVAVERDKFRLELGRQDIFINANNEKIVKALLEYVKSEYKLKDREHFGIRYRYFSDTFDIVPLADRAHSWISKNDVLGEQATTLLAPTIDTSDWAKDAAREIKAGAVFVKKCMEEAQARIKKKEKSIDEILSGS